MQDQFISQSVIQQIKDFINTRTDTHSLVILLICLFGAYLISRVLARGIVKITQIIAIRSDSAPDEKKVQLRRIETYLSVTVAVVKVLTVAIVGYVGWSLFSDKSSGSVAAIGAGTVFIVIAGGTISPILRDVTAGSTMIIERWFNVGDFIRVEPFMEVGGVVEKISLRSTKIRSLNGEVIWLHNQYIQGVKMTPRGIRTVQIDVFVRDLELGKKLIERVVSTIPTGTMTIVRKISIVREEQWAKDRWLLTVEGSTPPGREWLLDTYFPDSLKELDEQSEESVLLRKPIVRFADPAAEKSFKRAVRAK